MNIIEQRLSESTAVKAKMIGDSLILNKIQLVIDTILSALQNGKSIYFCGNGGSAADAQHIAAELSGRFNLDRRSLPAEALHCNTSFLTAVANDYSFDEIYARLITGIGHSGDVLVGLSTSGNSRNIVKALEESRKLGIKTIALTGESGGLVKDIADICVCVPSDNTSRIQEAHITIGHIVCEVIEDTLFGNK